MLTSAVRKGRKRHGQRADACAEGGGDEEEAGGSASVRGPACAGMCVWGGGRRGEGDEEARLMHSLHAMLT